MIAGKNAGRKRLELFSVVSVVVVVPSSMFVSMDVERAEELGWDFVVSCHDC